ncbi:RNase H domain-containing protein [Trichonephila clavipes]|nr:RNase H domain-containing protein [Trichonephila clavipes]
MKRLYDARPSNIRPFMDRMKLHISELDLPNVRIQQRNLFYSNLEYATVPYINPFATYGKSTVAPVVFQRVFAYHRSQYSRYSAIYTDGSKRADYVGCGVVMKILYTVIGSTLLARFHCRSCRHLPCTSINRLYYAP